MNELLNYCLQDCTWSLTDVLIRCYIYKITSVTEPQKWNQLANAIKRRRSEPKRIKNWQSAPLLFEVFERSAVFFYVPQSQHYRTNLRDVLSRRFFWTFNWLFNEFESVDLGVDVISEWFTSYGMQKHWMHIRWMEKQYFWCYTQPANEGCGRSSLQLI